MSVRRRSLRSIIRFHCFTSLNETISIRFSSPSLNAPHFQFADLFGLVMKYSRYGYHISSSYVMRAKIISICVVIRQIEYIIGTEKLTAAQHRIYIQMSPIVALII